MQGNSETPRDSVCSLETGIPYASLNAADVRTIYAGTCGKLFPGKGTGRAAFFGRPSRKW